jgi:hypothetical protein
VLKFFSYLDPKVGFCQDSLLLSVLTEEPSKNIFKALKNCTTLKVKMVPL